MNNNVVKNIVITNALETLEINEDCQLTIFNSELNNLTIKAHKKVAVMINDFRLIDSSKTNITLIADEEASISYHHAFINCNKYNLKLTAKYLGTKANITLNIHGLNDSGQANLQIDGIIGPDNYDNNLLENVKLINLNEGKATVVPNMLISNARVIANHNVAISNISKDECHYLMSKGLTNIAAKKLILNGFLINAMTDKNLITKIKELINGR